jgi:hypothetical protein
MTPRTGAGSPKESSRRPRCFTRPRIVCCSAAAGAPAAPEPTRTSQASQARPSHSSRSFEVSRASRRVGCRGASQRAPPTAFPRTLRCRKGQRCAGWLWNAPLHAVTPAAPTAFAHGSRRARPSSAPPATSASRANAPPSPARVVTPGALFLLVVSEFGGSQGSERKGEPWLAAEVGFFGERAREE